MINLTSNRKFEAKLEGHSQSFHACEEHGQSHPLNYKYTGTITPMMKAYVWVKPNFGRSSTACSQVYVYENKY